MMVALHMSKTKENCLVSESILHDSNTHPFFVLKQRLTTEISIYGEDVAQV